MALNFEILASSVDVALSDGGTLRSLNVTSFMPPTLTQVNLALLSL